MDSFGCGPSTFMSKRIDFKEACVQTGSLNGSYKRHKSGVDEAFSKNSDLEMNNECRHEKTYLVTRVPKYAKM